MTGEGGRVFSPVNLVTETETGRYSQFICPKTRIAPLQRITIPHLELMAARILATLLDTLKNALVGQIEISQVSIGQIAKLLYTG